MPDLARQLRSGALHVGDLDGAITESLMRAVLSVVLEYTRTRQLFAARRLRFGQRPQVTLLR
jgi:hypothetical protein